MVKHSKKHRVVRALAAAKRKKPVVVIPLAPISFHDLSASAASGSTTINTVVPAGVAPGHRILVMLTTKLGTQTPVMVTTGYTRIGTGKVGGAGADGVDSGNVQVNLWEKIAEGNESGATLNFTIPSASGNYTVARVLVYKGDSRLIWSIAYTVGADNVAGGAVNGAFLYRASGEGTINLKPGDMLIAINGSNDLATAPSHTGTNPANSLPNGLSATGITFGTQTKRMDNATSGGNHVRQTVVDALVTAGTGDVTPVSQLQSTPGGTSAFAGATIFIRLRQINPGEPVEPPGDVTGLQHYNIDTIAADVAGGMVPNMSVHGGLLRPDFDNDNFAIFKTNVGGFDWLEHRVRPRTPSNRLPTPSGFQNHFRAEIGLYPWEIKMALGTEFWMGKSFYIPSDVGQWVQQAINMFQVKDSSNALDNTGDPDPSPALSLELSYPGQLNGSSIYRRTPLGGEIQMINHARGSRWTAADSALRLAPGMRIDWITQIRFAIDGTGVWRNWFNGVEYPMPSHSSGGVTYAGDAGPTVVGNYPGYGWRSGNPKSGIYCLQFKTPSLVAANEAAGHTQMRLLVSDWNTVTRTPADPDYMSMNAKDAVDTSTYNR